jgi:hypothetical protein
MYTRKFSKRVFPPKGYIIQGILKPEWAPKENKKIKNIETPHPGKPEVKLCSTCDFLDKQSRNCLIKRLHCSCPYTNGSTGYVVFKIPSH